jgi:hypothetical protein
MFASSVDTLDFRFIGRHLVPHNIFIQFIMIFGHLPLLASWVLNIALSFLMIFHTTLGLFLCV